MLISKFHNVKIYSRNKSKWISQYPNIKQGDTITVTSEQLLTNKVTKIKLDCRCDRCGKEYVTVTCKAIDKPRKLILCESCGRSDDMTKYYQTDEGKAKAIRTGEIIKSSKSYRLSRLASGKKYTEWFNSEDAHQFRENLINRVKRDFTKYGPENPNWNPEKIKYREYTRMCRRYTNQNKNVFSTWENYDKIGRCGVEGAYQLDHIIPIRYGFDNNICPSVIGHITNLQIITWEENRRKSDNIR